MSAFTLLVFAFLALCAQGQDLPVYKISGFQEEDRVFKGPALYVIYKEFIVAEGVNVKFDSSESEVKILFESWITVDGRLDLIGNDMAITWTNRSSYQAIKLGQKGVLSMTQQARVIDITPQYERTMKPRVSFLSLSCCNSQAFIEDAVFTDLSDVITDYTGFTEIIGTIGCYRFIYACSSSSFLYFWSSFWLPFFLCDSLGSRFIRSTTSGSYTRFSQCHFENSTVYGETIHFYQSTFFNDSSISPHRGGIEECTFADCVSVWLHSIVRLSFRFGCLVVCLVVWFVCLFVGLFVGLFVCLFVCLFIESVCFFSECSVARFHFSFC
jgi:hypothetical protein